MKIKLFIVIMILTAVILPAEQSLSGNGIDLRWKTGEDRLIVTLSAPTTGWIAFGIGAEEVMKNANIIMVWVDDDMGIAMADDQYGNGRFSHKNDMKLGGEQNVQVLSGEQTGESTSVTFSIPLDSGDRFDNPLEIGETYRYILAYGKTDNLKAKHKATHSGDLTIR